MWYHTSMRFSLAPFAVGFYLLFSGGNYAESQPIGRCNRCKSGVSLHIQLTLLQQRQSGKPGCFCLHRFEVIALTVCPLNGKCIYNHRIDTGVNFCGRSAYAYPDLQRKALVKAIFNLSKSRSLSDKQRGTLKKYQATLRGMVIKGGEKDGCPIDRQAKKENSS